MYAVRVSVLFCSQSVAGASVRAVGSKKSPRDRRQKKENVLRDFYTFQLQQRRDNGALVCVNVRVRIVALTMQARIFHRAATAEAQIRGGP